MTNQRDRFRQKNLELEEQHRATQTQVKSLKSDLEGLRNDNLKLFEKLRYTSTFNTRKDEVAIEVRRSSGTSRNDVTGKYQQIYDDNLDPFKRFNKQVRFSQSVVA